MLLILFSWFICTAVFLAFGDLLLTLFSSFTGKKSQYTTIDIFWFGLIAIGSMLMVISLFLPINIHVTGVIIFITIVYWIINRKKGKTLIKKLINCVQNLPLWTQIILIIILIAVLIFSIQPKQVYDYGLYYVQTMMWNKQYSVVPGLGNLHGRLAFNSSFLLLSTLFYNPELFSPFFPLNSLFLMVFLTWVIIEIYRRKGLIQQIILFAIVCMMLISYVMLLSTSNTDMLTNIMGLYILIKCILNRDSFRNNNLLFVAIPFFCMTLKTSTAPITLIAIFALLYQLKIKDYKNFIQSVVLASFIAVPWIIRSIILSGYLIYPLASIDIFSFDWKIPHQMVEMESLITRTWAIAPSVPLASIKDVPIQDWIYPWFKRFPLFEKSLYILAIISPLTLLFFSYRKIRQNPIIFYSWLTAFIGFIICFISAPTPRFGFVFIIYSGIVPFLILKPKLESNKTCFTYISILLILVSAYFLRSSLKQSMLNKPESMSYFSLVVHPMYYDFNDAMQKIDYQNYKVGDAIIYSPNEVGATPISCYEICPDLCFDKALPCTPYLNTNLEMRGKTLQDGFKIKQ